MEGAKTSREVIWYCSSRETVNTRQLLVMMLLWAWEDVTVGAAGTLNHRPSFRSDPSKRSDNPHRLKLLDYC